MHRFATITFVCCLLCGCSKPKASDIPGAYIARRSYGTEMLQLHTNGSYEQAFTTGGSTSRTNVGKWTFDAEQSLVALDGALLFDDGWGSQASPVRTITW